MTEKYRFNISSVMISYDQCYGRGFSPAWWLNPKVEARRAYHFATVAAVACEFGVPTSLLDAVIAQESGYKYWAISPKGAMGMMQIMPGTATQLGFADPFNSLANMRAGARYLREQLDRFGRVDLALAAYNAGPHRRSLKEGRLPMISETLSYVQTILINWARLSPRNVEIASVDRGAIAAAAVAKSGFRSVSLVRYDGGSAKLPQRRRPTS
jgi:soluble lytic murein transglycosylase-like protein